MKVPFRYRMRDFLPRPLKFLLLQIHRGRYQLKMWISFVCRDSSVPPVYVYQMGKVASLSLYNSLRKRYPGSIATGHGFSLQYPDWRVRRLYRIIAQQKKPVNIISLTREPVSRNVSAFFQNYRRYVGTPFRQSRHSLEELRALFLERFAHDETLNWLDRNLEAHFGIDVYQSPFPDRGFDVYQKENIRLLLMRFELANRDKEAILEEFLGIAGVHLESRNVGANKEYAEVYWLFKERVKLPAAYLDRMCGSRYFRHFYGPQAADAVRERWSEE